MTRGPRRGLRAVALAAAGTLLLTGCDFSVYDLPLPGGADVGDDPYEVTAEFRDVLDLVPQSSVKVDDITVGKVEDVEVDGYHAKVTLLLSNDVKLPGNAEAEIRQTSLLGEKFVSLAPPPSNPSSDRLGDGDVIGLDRTGRNPEVEEVLGALSLLLNGGGIGQLKLITNELNKTFSGREESVKSVLQQLRYLMEQFDGRKDEIVTALEQVNSLAKSLNAHTSDLDLALDELPSAIASVDRQRDDLVKMLKALSDLSSVGVRVIKQSKAGTIDSLNALAPVLTELAKAGDDLPNSLQIFLTFPFIDAVVGKNPQQARDLHMGDYTNLSIDLQLDSDALGDLVINEIDTTVCQNLPAPLKQQCVSLLQQGKKLTKKILKALKDLGVDPGDIPTPPVPPLGIGSGGNGGGNGGILGGLGTGLGRAPVGAQPQRSETSRAAHGHDLTAMLLWGVMDR